MLYYSCILYMSLMSPAECVGIGTLNPPTKLPSLGREYHGSMTWEWNGNLETLGIAYYYYY